MSDTLRTDVLLIAHDMSPEPKVLIKHGRDLEHQLNAANERIKRLEEAGDAMMEEPCEYTFEQWIQAKEAKL